MKKLMFALAVLAVAAFASAEPFVWPSAWSNAVNGGTLRSYMIGDPRTFNPITTAESQALSDHIFSGGLLITRGPDSDEWVPYAAESFTPNEAGTVVDVVLRDDVVWSDGEPVTVQDYYTTYLLETDPDTESNGYDSWFMDDDKIQMEITGDNTLRFTFPRPDRLAFPVIAMAPTRDSIFGEAYRSGGAEAVKALWGTGVDLSTTVWTSAFIPVSFTPGERVILEANPTFGQWNVDEAGNPLPYLDGYSMTVAGDLDAALNLYIAGEIDSFSPRNLDDIGVIAQAINNGDIDAIIMESVSPVPSSQFIVWNWNLASNPDKQELFRSQNFRRAMAHLIDRDLMIDLVYNGAELGSGSIRIHDSALQRRIFGLLGLDDDEIQQKFGFLLRALDAGAPPHGGVAFGMDRIVQRFAGAPSLRDVIAFPKTTGARALFEGAPVPIAPDDLADLGLALRGASIPQPERE